MVGELSQSLRRLGLVRRVVLVHASMRSFAERLNAESIIEELLDLGSTVVVPTFTGRRCSVFPPPHGRPPRNGIDYGTVSRIVSPPGELFDAGSANYDRQDMGAFPGAVLANAARARGLHPLCSFAGIGAYARVVETQTSDDVYAPLRALAELEGLVLRIGVGLNKMTLLHLAEEQAGRNLFYRWAAGQDSEPVVVRMGGCSAGFPRLAADVVTTGSAVVFGSQWHVDDSTRTLARVSHRIRRDPFATHCGDEACIRCRDAALGGPPTDRSVWIA